MPLLTYSTKTVPFVPTNTNTRSYPQHYESVKMVKKVSEKANQLTAQNFASRYGKEETKLASWQLLCRDVGVDEGSSVTQCKKVLHALYQASHVEYTDCLI